MASIRHRTVIGASGRSPTNNLWVIRGRARVPVHTTETYRARLIRAGFKVAICDQIEDPAEAKRRGAKGPARRHNYLAGLAEAGGEIEFMEHASHGKEFEERWAGQHALGLAWLDLSTGAFALAPTSEPALAGDLARLMPGEILLPAAYRDVGAVVLAALGACPAATASSKNSS